MYKGFILLCLGNKSKLSYNYIFGEQEQEVKHCLLEESENICENNKNIEIELNISSYWSKLIENIIFTSDNLVVGFS